MAERNDDLGDWIRAEASGGGLALLGWGLGSVAALVLAFASWQYAPTPTASPVTVRAEVGQPDPSEITGSIGATEEGRTTVQPSRTFGVGRLAPLPLGADESPATSRDIDRLRVEISEIRRRIVQIGMAGEGISRRIDGIEERVTSAAPAAARPSPPLAAIAPAEPVAPEGPRPATRTAERLPTPPPRPASAPPAVVPTIPYDADGPTTTGAVPKSARHTDKPAAADPRPATPDAAAEDRAPKPATGEAAAPTPPPAAPSEPPRPVRVVGTQPGETAPAAPPAAAPTPPPGAAAPVAIDLGGFRSLASLRRAWADTATRHTALAKDLEPLARLRETESGMEARLLVGPFADQTEAAKACLRLKATGAVCTVATYAGQPIAGLR